MCSDCDPNWELPTPREIAEPDPTPIGISFGTLADLGDALGALPSHQPWNCPTPGERCDDCHRAHRAERIIEETENEREYDADRWAS